MDKTPLVSVAIPVHDCENFLIKCVRSVYAQTYAAVELVLVDDGSKDSCCSLIERLRAERPSHVEVVVITHERARGVSVARNAAAAGASGEYLFFIDADDWIEPGCLEDMVAHAIEHDLEVCCGTHEYYHSETDRETDFNTGGTDALYESSTAVARAYSEKNLSTFTWNKLMKRSLFGEGGLGFEESIMNDEDQLWSFRLVMRVERWMTLGKLSYHYRKDNPTSITAESYTMRRLRNYYSVLGFMKEELANGVDWSSERSVFIARGVLNFTKSILWHIEYETDADYRSLYAEFKRKNILRTDGAAYRRLRGKNRFFAWGWDLPYPLSRCMSPYFLHKIKTRLVG